MCSFTAPWQGKRYVSLVETTHANEIKNVFLGLSCNTPQGTQCTCPFFKRDNYLLSPKIFPLPDRF